MMQNKNNTIGDLKKNRDIKKPEAAIYYLYDFVMKFLKINFQK